MSIECCVLSNVRVLACRQCHDQSRILILENNHGRKNDSESDTAEINWKQIRWSQFQTILLA